MSDIAATQPDQSARKEYRLKQPIIQGGVEKKEGDKVLLTKRQAEKFLKSGHI